MSIKRRSRAKITAAINVTPLVDVMLVLLIIFMVTSPMLVTGVTIDLPKTEAGPIAGSDEPVAVTINKKGEVFIAQNKIELKSLGVKLNAITKAKKDTRIFVRGDKDIDYGTVMEVFAVIKKSGFNNVALVSEKL